MGSTLEEIRKVKDSLESERDMFIIKIPQMVLNLKLGFNGEGEDITPVVEDFSLDFEDTGGFKPKDEKTKEERSLDNRKKVYPLNYEQTLFLDDAEIEGCNYSDFSWDTFLYFLYWRTCLRNNIITKTPSVFMSSYIADICILVECDTPQIAYERLEELYNLFLVSNEDVINNKGWILRYITRAINGIRIYYSDSFDGFDIKEYFSNHRGIIDNNMKQLIWNAQYNKTFDYFAENSSYKVKNSSFYIENKDTYLKCFNIALPKIVQYFNNKGMEIITLWLGSRMDNCNKDNMFPVLDKRFLSKKKIKVLDDYEICIDERGIHDTRFNPCSPLTDRRDVFEYFLWHLESTIRNKMNYRYKLKPNVDFLVKKANEYRQYGTGYTTHAECYRKLAILYGNKEYEEIIKNVVDSVIA